MFDHRQLRRSIIRPALKSIGLYTVAAEELLIATCAIESQGGTYLVQTSAGGVAKGVYQMEPATHDDLWQYLSAQHLGLISHILDSCNYRLQPSADEMVNNLRYASIMARVLYFVRTPQDLPPAENLEGLWQHYKLHWNTLEGAATQEKFYSAYYHFVGGHKPGKSRR